MRLTWPKVKRRSSFPWVQLFWPYRPEHTALRLVPGDLLAPTPVAVATPQPPGGAVGAAWIRSGGSHKWLHYFPIYENALRPFVGAAPRILEIGVAGGGSLPMWRDHLGEGSVAVGIDIDPTCRAFDRPERQIHVRIGSQADAAFLRAVVREFGPFDIILDDGSHVVSHMIQTFGALFDTGLRPGGLYMVEDTHTSYWRPFRDRPYAFSQFVHELIDLQHAVYWRAPHSSFFNPLAANHLDSVSVPRLTTLLGSIEAHDSIVLIHRRRDVLTLPANLRGTDFTIVRS